jgi:hypothetical protein
LVDDSQNDFLGQPLGQQKAYGQEGLVITKVVLPKSPLNPAVGAGIPLKFAEGTHYTRPAFIKCRYVYKSNGAVDPPQDEAIKREQSVFDASKTTQYMYGY